jgi:hypothetical protein
MLGPDQRAQPTDDPRIGKVEGIQFEPTTSDDVETLWKRRRRRAKVFDDKTRLGIGSAPDHAFSVSIAILVLVAVEAEIQTGARTDLEEPDVALRRLDSWQAGQCGKDDSASMNDTGLCPPFGDDGLE